MEYVKSLQSFWCSEAVFNSDVHLMHVAFHVEFIVGLMVTDGTLVYCRIDVENFDMFPHATVAVAHFVALKTAECGASVALFAVELSSFGGCALTFF